MRILKNILLVVVGILALGAIIAAFLPTHFEMEGSKEINASKEVVYSQINDLKTWQEWGPWKDDDPNMEVSFGDPSAGLGGNYSWKSEKLGNGKMTITEVDPPNAQKAKLEFEGMGESESWMKLTDGTDGATLVTWGFSYDMPWPINLMSLFSSEAEANDMFERGLTKLKAMSEAKATAAPASYTVSEIDYPGQTYLAIRETVSFENVGSDFFATRYGKIMELMGKTKMEMQGAPSGLYYTWDEATKTTDMAAAIPVKGSAAVNGGDIKVITLPAGKAFVIDYYGPYDGTGAAHMALDEYLKNKGVEAGTPAIEEYVTDPTTEPDTAKWLTKITYFSAGPIAQGQ